ncbi:M3 family metallopeptidase [Corynebacterium heidelbergense]|uniref:Peptidase n=1 Tax=Corynebacterium heidelbergense TaxID=2055947 RepID=A0A364VDN8_9CORY|nr:M3 family metallopeptidase [Corynebacterium heidelbergense]RAV34676.1 peptidase [Corynebacterium heidelbergense]WCZ36248.1 Peptidyl-dipeptidase dcp [Corynebacterium heidelbergense]
MEDFLNASDLPYGLPDFGSITLDSLVPAFRTAVVDHAAEIEAIAVNPAEPTWENTMEALESAGQMLHRVCAIVFNYAGTLADGEVQAVEAAVSPELAAHMSRIALNEQLWRRVQSMPEQPEGSEEAALLEHWRKRFVRGGANLSGEQRDKLATIDARLAELCTGFGTSLQRATQANAVLLAEEETAGLDAATIQRLAAAAAAAGHPEGTYLVHLGLPSVQPILAELEKPAARRKVYEGSLHRSDGVNDAAILDIARLRAQRAELLGYANHAEFVVEDETAGSVSAVEGLLNQLTPAAVANALGEHKRLVDKAAEDGGSPSAAGNDADAMGAADWSFWDARLRAEELSVDETEIRQYFQLDRVLVDGAFYAAKRLYGIDVAPREDLAGYHEDVRVWEVREADGRPIGLLLTDMFARPTKRGGAWMSSFQEQSHLLGTLPVVVNVMNIAKPAPAADGSPGVALLSMDEVKTVFHEFGHALHGLLSDVRYPSLSGTNVPRDFVEFPSQINENWALEPEVLRNYARHVDTGEELPADYAAAVAKQAQWGQGFATTEYLAACWVDMAWHTLSAEEAAAIDDVAAFEERAVERAGVGVDKLIAPRYRSAYFNHIFSSGLGYSAGYWSYLWAEVLDADGFQAFVDTGAAHGAEAAMEGRVRAVADADPEDVRFAGDRFRRMILSRGASIDYEDAFWMFRGKQRSVQPLLERRGLAGAIAPGAADGPKHD